MLFAEILMGVGRKAPANAPVMVTDRSRAALREHFVEEFIRFVVLEYHAAQPLLLLWRARPVPQCGKSGIPWGQVPRRIRAHKGGGQQRDLR